LIVHVSFFSSASNEPRKKVRSFEECYSLHFPGKVKKVKLAYADRTDRETAVVEIPQEKLTDEDFEPDLTVKFKGLK
jgi:hypothetical protein